MAVEINPSTHYLISLEDLSRYDADSVGAKAANEAEMLNAGLPVPRGLVLTTRAFDRFVETNGLAPSAPPERVATAEIPDDISAALRVGFEALGNVPLAVRSSAIAEDLPDASFAGQYETILDVRGAEALGEAVRRCWASAFSHHVVAYRESHGLPATAMAVLIQELVPADAAGVAFTANPVTGSRDEVVINAVQGLGNRLVSGEVSPDEWTVKGSEAHCRSAPEGSIDAEQAKAIARTARHVQHHFGRPQDIEWALAEGRLLLLQTRPITTLPEEVPKRIPLPVEPPPGYWQHDASHFPQAVYPMSRLLMDPIKAAITTWVEAFGYLMDGLELMEIGGWLYQRMVPLGGKEGPALPGWAMWLMVRLMPMARARIRRSVEAVRSDRPGHYIERWYLEWQPELAARIAELRDVDLPPRSDAELTAHTDATLDLLARGIEVHAYAHGALACVLYEASTTCRELLCWEDDKVLELVNGTSFKSTEPARKIHQLVLKAREQPALEDLLERIDEGTMARIAEAAPAFAEELQEYLKKYGCRILTELAEPTLAEMPNLVLAQIRGQIESGYDPDRDHARLAERRAEAAAGARAMLAERPPELERFERALERALKAYPVREDNEFFTLSCPLALVRYAILEIGARLADRGVIEERDDVFFLEHEEARSALHGGDDLRELVRRRKAERAWAQAHPGPPSYGEEPGPPPSFDFLPREARLLMEALLWSFDKIFDYETSGRVQQLGGPLAGIAASRGSYTGTVRVIMHEGDFDKLKPGDVLVCPATSPVWSVLFPNVGALVTDKGGILSHPAIIAREYGVPAVVAMGNATSLLRDGQIISVDGDAGTVTVAP